MPSQASLQAPVEPGSTNTKVLPITPAVARDCRVDVPIVPDCFIINIGDLLARWTNDTWVSTLHRVVNPPGEQARKPRYSVPFFLHPNPDFLIDVLPSCISADNPSRYPEPITAHGFLEERLREIKLK